MTSQKIENSFDNLRELILVEDFKGCIAKEIKTYLDERKADKLHEAAVLADDYELTHKSFFGKQKQGQFRPRFGKKSEGTGNLSPSKKSEEQKPDSSPQSDKPASQKTGQKFFSGPTCNYCHKKGHVKSECFALQRKLNQTGKPVGLASIKGRPPLDMSDGHFDHLHAKVENPHDGVLVAEPILNGYESFKSEGLVSQTENAVDQKAVVILRDTGAAQSLLLEGVLPLSHETYQKASVLLQGVEGNYITVLLHKVYLKSDFKIGPVIVGIVPTLPIEGVTFLLGNDIAGDNVKGKPVPYLTDEPVTREDTEHLEQEFPGIFPACVVTRSMALEASKQKEASDKDDECLGLAETFFGNLDDQVSHDGNLSPEVSHDGNLTDQVSQIGHPSQMPHLNRERLIREQKADPQLRKLASTALTEEEAQKDLVCYYIKSGVLMRKWRPPDASTDEEWRVVHQIVVPPSYRAEILRPAHFRSE